VFLRRYHGFFISFALLNDFWYHPFESTAGHLLGVLNDVLILRQSVFIYTPAHRNTFWMLALEVCVVPHSGLIAIQRGVFTGNGSAGAFGFGFLIFMLLNQIHGKKLNLTRLQKLMLFVLFAVSVTLTYGLGLEPKDGTSRKTFKDMPEIFQRMPLLCFASMGMFILLHRIGTCFVHKCSAPVQIALGSLVFVIPFFLFFGVFMGLFSIRREVAGVAEPPGRIAR